MSAHHLVLRANLIGLVRCVCRIIERRCFIDGWGLVEDEQRRVFLRTLSLAPTVRRQTHSFTRLLIPANRLLFELLSDFLTLSKCARSEELFLLVAR